MLWDILVIVGSVLQIIGCTILIRKGPSPVNGLHGLVIPRPVRNMTPEDAAFVASQRAWVKRGSALVISGAIIQLISYWARWMNA